MIDPRLLVAARAGEVLLLERLVRIEVEEQLLHGTTPEGNTALHIAAKLGHVDFAAAIGRARTSLLLQQNSRGDSPLHCAARAGHDALVSIFLKFPVKEELCGLTNRGQNSALHEAVLNDRVSVVATLMREYPALASLVNNAGASPLYLAADRKSLDVVSLLLTSPLASHAGPNGQTALHAAVLRSHEITELILSKKPNLLQEADATGSNPLHYAASNSDLGMVELLLNHDPSVANLKDKDGLSAMHVAASMGYLHLIKLLIQRSPASVELVDNRGRNLLHVAIEKKRLDVVEFALWEPELFDLVNEPDYEGNTPLHSAIMNKNWRIVRVLLDDKRVKTDVVNNSCQTPLDLATLNTERGLALRMYKIMVELVSTGARFSPRRLDQVLTKLQRDSEEESNRCRTLANNLAIVAVLIATVTFAAAFTLPGGYRNDPGPGQGTAVLTRKWAFRVFLVSDAVAMVSSIVAACALIYAGSQDHDVRLHSLGVAMRLIWVALGGMVVAFATGAYVVVAPDCLWLAILVCLIVCSAPLLVWLTTSWPTINSRNTTRTPVTRDRKDHSRVSTAPDVGRCSPLLHKTPEAMNPLMATTVNVVTSRMPRFHSFRTPAGSPNPMAVDRMHT